jgi:heme exporter protein A
MLEALNLGCVRGQRRLFRALNFSLPSGSLLQVTGANGSGKTSLIRILSGLMTPNEGEVRWQGSATRTLGDDYRTVLTYVGHKNGIKDELNPVENLRFASGLCGIQLSVNKARAALDRMGLAEASHLPARNLSAGQRRRAALARLLISESKLWLLDEVTTSLDAEGVQLTQEIISEHLGHDGIAVVATHEELTLPAGSMQRLQLDCE